MEHPDRPRPAALVRCDGDDAGLIDDPRRPTFMVIGAMKAGTTSLWHYLSSHPDVAMSMPKEPDHFALERPSAEEWSRYLSLFGDAAARTVRGEASTSYTKALDVSGVPGRIKAALPDIRLIYVVREPVARMRSQYRHEVDRGEETLSFDDAVRQRSRYLQWSRYGHQASLFLEHFPAEQLLIISSEDLLDRPRATMATVFAHIGVRAIDSPGFDVRHHEGDAKFAFAPRWELLRQGLRRSGVGRHLPRRWKRRVRATVGTTVPASSLELDARTVHEIRGELRADLDVLRTIAPADCTLWDLAER